MAGFLKHTKKVTEKGLLVSWSVSNGEITLRDSAWQVWIAKKKLICLEGWRVPNFFQDRIYFWLISFCMGCLAWFPLHRTRCPQAGCALVSSHPILTPFVCCLIPLAYRLLEGRDSIFFLLIVSTALPWYLSYSRCLINVYWIRLKITKYKA